VVPVAVEVGVRRAHEPSRIGQVPGVDVAVAVEIGFANHRSCGAEEIDAASYFEMRTLANESLIT
jgi:hypothetical protein